MRYQQVSPSESDLNEPQQHATDSRAKLAVVIGIVVVSMLLAHNLWQANGSPVPTEVEKEAVSPVESKSDAVPPAAHGLGQSIKQKEQGLAKIIGEYTDALIQKAREYANEANLQKNGPQAKPQTTKQPENEQLAENHDKNDDELAALKKQQDLLNAQESEASRPAQATVNQIPNPNAQAAAPSQPVPTQQKYESMAFNNAKITKEQKIKWFKFVELKNQGLSSSLAQEQKKYYEQKYNISKYPELPFCLVVPSYNNVQKDRYIHNINSILQQDYSNYRIVFIDDASDDGTGDMMRTYARQHRIAPAKLKIIQNKERTMAMPNIYRAAHQECNSYELLAIVDGDDELVGKQVLKFFNAVVQSNDLWVAYSNYISFRGTLGYSRPYSHKSIDQNAYRNSSFLISHLRVFYTKLLQRLDKLDLQDESGNWFHAANDVAMYIPILEQTHNRVAYFPEICYMYNSNTGLNNHKIKKQQQKANEKIIRAKQSYQPLLVLFTQEQLTQLREATGRQVAIVDETLPPTEGVQKYGWQL